MKVKHDFKPGDPVYYKDLGTWWRGLVSILDGNYVFVVDHPGDFRARRIHYSGLRRR